MQPLIEEIANELNKASISLVRSLRGSLDVVKMTYGVAPHRTFVLEYLQNAVDAGAQRCTFIISEDQILVSNDGSEFSEENVKAFCSIAQSSKQPAAGFIGFIGIGAKSAFLLGDRLEVHSGRYHFAFDKATGEDKPWEMLPLEIDQCYNTGCTVNQSNHKTTFLLTKLLKDRKENLTKIFFDQNDTYYIDARTLLFVPAEKLCLELEDRTLGRRRVVRREILHKELWQTENIKLDLQKVLLQENFGEEQRTEKWLVLSKTIGIDSSVREDEFTRLYRRDKVTERVISVAFLLDDNEDLVSCRGIVKFGVFSYLPIKEVESGLNFLIHADFITEPGRATIASEALWNKHIRKKIEEFILNEVCAYLKNNDKYKYQTAILIPRETPTGFIWELIYHIKEGLKNSEIIFTYEGFQKPSNSLLLPSYVYNILRDDEIPHSFKIYGTLYTIHKNAAMHTLRLVKSREVLRSVGICVLTLSDIIANVPRRESLSYLYSSIITHLDSVESYKELFSYLLNNELEDVRNNSFRLLNNLLLLTESGQKGFLSRRVYLAPYYFISDVFALPLQKVQEFVSNNIMLKGVVDKYGRNKLIHQQLLDTFKLFIEKLGGWYAYVERSEGTHNLVEELEGSESAINSFLKSLQDYVRSEALKLTDELDEAIKKDNLEEVKKLTKNLLDYFSTYPKLFESEEMRGKIKFKVKGKKEFKPATELLLPYSGAHRIGEIIEKIDSYVEKGCNSLSKYLQIKKRLLFPDLTFYKEFEPTIVDFIKALGGDKILDDVEVKRKIVDGLGIQCVAVWEWRKHGHEVKEVEGRSYDLEVKEKGLCIEVKSTSHTLDEEVELRRGQIDALLTDTNTTLYIVTEVLSQPKGYIADKELVSNILKEVNVKVRAKELVNPSTTAEDILS